MSINDYTTTSTAFDDLFGPIEAWLGIWGTRAFWEQGTLARDEAMQVTRVQLWQNMTSDPSWLSKPPAVWMSYAKQVYRHSILHQRKVDRLSDSVEVLANNYENVTGDEALSRKLYAQRVGHKRYDRDIHLAEIRVDLERTLAKGFQMLDERYHADMWQVIECVQLGYNQVEVQEKYGWSGNHVRVLYRHLRTTFYEALTGEKRDPDGGAKAPASEDERRRCFELRQQGLSHAKIAARLDRSKGWVMQNLRKPICRPELQAKAKRRADLTAQAQQLRETGMSYRDIAAQLGVGYNTIHRWIGKRA